MATESNEIPIRRAERFGTALSRVETALAAAGIAVSAVHQFRRWGKDGEALKIELQVFVPGPIERDDSGAPKMTTLEHEGQSK